MSIASPTLRSSSSTAPGPSLSNCETSIFARPSTAETCTGTSNIASRSAAVLPAGSGSVGGVGAAASGPGCSRSGRETSSLMGVHLSKLGILAARGEIASDGFGDCGLDRGAVAGEAAVGPFDAAIVRLHVRLGHDHEAAGKAEILRDRVELFAGLRVDRVGDAHHDVRRGVEVAQAIGDEGRDLDERFALQQFRRKLARDRRRNLDRFDFELGLDRREALGQRAELFRDAVERQTEAPRRFGLRFGLRCGKAAGVSARLGLAQFFPVFGKRHGIGRAIAGSEIDLEHVSGGGAHQYTSSSSPRCLLMMISPLAARSFAMLTSICCASSTARSRTGPIACMSSASILAARADMFERKNWRTGSAAPLSATASLSLSMLRISVCAEPASSFIRSSKVNISVLMRSALSRFSSSSAVMKRVSVWRSKLLKISAINSCASRRRVWERFDMN